jgi:peptide/nickel transport system ATP-binding protein
VPTEQQQAGARPAATSAQPLLSVQNLSVEFASSHGWSAVTDNVAFDVRAGETVGLVGESGSGKTVTSLALMGLLGEGRAAAGSSIVFQGQELVGLPNKKLNRVRGNEIAMIFQEPMTSLNPAFTVGHQVAEMIRLHRDVSRKQAWQRAVEMLDVVGIPSPAKRAEAYPHHFSGGMAQRAMIAMALSCDPKLLIADEPTTALDVTVEANILDLLRSLQQQFGMAILLVTHDLGVVNTFCERALVMYAGQIVAEAPVKDLFARPEHPYVEGLLQSIPNPSSDSDQMWSIPGVVPAANAMPRGCRFNPRCPYVVEHACTEDAVELRLLHGHRVRCVRSEDLELKGIDVD